jgi:hypothetical protein
MAIPMHDDLQLGKVSKLLGALLEQDTTANINAALTVLGQLGYDTDLKRAKIFDGISAEYLLQQNDISTDSTFATPSNTEVPSTQAVVTYIGNVIAAGTRIRGSVTMTTAGTYPLADASLYASGTQIGDGSGAGPTIKTGDAWYIGQAQSYQMGPTAGKLVKQGDMVIALADGAGNNDAQWLVLQANVDMATTTVPGLVLLTTLAKLQANAGADADNAVTVSTLRSYLANPESADAAANYYKTTKITQSMSNGPNTVTHNKNTQDIAHVSFRVANQEVQMGWTAATVNTLTVNRTAGTATVDTFITYKSS